MKTAEEFIEWLKYQFNLTFTDVGEMSIKKQLEKTAKEAFDYGYICADNGDNRPEKSFEDYWDPGIIK